MSSSNVSNPAKQNEDEIDFMDILLIISEKIKTLLLFTFLGAILASFYILLALAKPEEYRSISTITVNTDVPEAKLVELRSDILVNLITSSPSFSQLQNSNQKIEAQRDKKNQTVKITAIADSPVAAQQLNQATLKKIFEITAPRGEDAKRLENLLTNELKRLNEVEKIISGISLNPHSSPESIRAYGVLLDIASSRELSIIQIQKQLKGISEQDVVLSPTVPEQAQSIEMKSPIIIGILIGGFTGIFWIFTSHAFFSIRNNAQNNIKFSQIKANLGFKS